MIVRVAVLVGWLVAGTTATIFANLSVMKMIDEINAKLPPAERISNVGFGPWKSIYIFTVYRDKCPDGNTNERAIRRGLLVFLIWAVGAVWFVSGEVVPGLP